MRYLDPFILEDLERGMILLSGPRQCGKTTFSKELLKREKKGEYLNWDQPKDRKRILKQDWSEDTRLLVLDEVQKKTWKTFLKGVYDTKPESMRMLVTGSARLELFQKSGDSMFGRFRPWRLHPFCLAEDPLKLDRQARLERELERGGFPVPYLTEDPAISWIARWGRGLRTWSR